jgi:non-ribosomal peptide synthetase component F
MFLSILATHKAGGSYVQLDPEYPAERIRTIVSLAEVTLVFATGEPQKRLVSVLSGTGVDCVLVDLNELPPAAKPEVRPACRDDICHVLFTSGLTGTPCLRLGQPINVIYFRRCSDTWVHYRERGCVPRSHWHSGRSGAAICQLYIRRRCLGEYSTTPDVT